MRVLPDIACGFGEEHAGEPHISSDPSNQPRPDQTAFPDKKVNWKNQPSLLPGRYVATARAACESYPTYQDQFIVTPFHPGKRYTTCGFRSEAVSHDFAGFILIIAQLEVAALPESKEAYRII